MGKSFIKFGLFLVLALGVLISGCKKDDDDKDTKGYNFTPPTSWTHETVAGGIETYTGPADGGFYPKISIVTEIFSGKLTEYVDANINSLKIVFDIELVSRAAFQSNGGLSGERLVYLATVGGFNIRYVTHLFSPKRGNNTYVVISGSGLASWDNKYDATFDTAANGSGQFITFNDKGCYDSDKSGF